MRVAVVIPTLNEAKTVVGTLRRLAREGPDEVVVVDAGSDDGTAALARGEGVRVLESPRGRGVQQNRGAAAVGGDVLVFLHADCWLEAGALVVLRRFLGTHPRIPGGCFRMRVESDRPAYRLIDGAADVRGGLLAIPYGDQGLFVRRSAFQAVGGFPEIPLMEDVYFSLRLRRLGRLALVPARIHVSPRRWERYGILRQSVRNWWLTASAAAGVPVGVLARHYPSVR
jgi:rSAM/selenodomain-associated transferase 2